MYKQYAVAFLRLLSALGAAYIVGLAIRPFRAVVLRTIGGSPAWVVAGVDSLLTAMAIGLAAAGALWLFLIPVLRSWRSRNI